MELNPEATAAGNFHDNYMMKVHGILAWDRETTRPLSRPEFRAGKWLWRHSFMGNVLGRYFERCFCGVIFLGGEVNVEVLCCVFLLLCLFVHMFIICSLIYLFFFCFFLFINFVIYSFCCLSKLCIFFSHPINVTRIST